MLIIRMFSLFLFALLLLGFFTVIMMMLRNQAGQGGKAKSKKGNLPSDDGIRELIRSGDKQAAIDLYRRFTGVDEFTARHAVEEIERELRLNDAEQEKFCKILEDKGKAAAIEAYQASTGANLADALEFIESL